MGTRRVRFWFRNGTIDIFSSCSKRNPEVVVTRLIANICSMNEELHKPRTLKKNKVVMRTGTKQALGWSSSTRFLYIYRQDSSSTDWAVAHGWNGLSHMIDLNVTTQGCVIRLNNTHGSETACDRVKYHKCSSSRNNVRKDTPSHMIFHTRPSTNWKIANDVVYLDIYIERRLHTWENI
jgi:hypothetical protein